MAGIPTGFKGKQPGDRGRKRAVGDTGVGVGVGGVVGVIMKDFKISMDGPVKKTTGFHALHIKMRPGENKSEIALTR